MAIDWLYDDGHVAFGVEWNFKYSAVNKVTVEPQIWRWDSQNTSDGTSFTETLDGAETYTVAWGSGGGYRLVDSWRKLTYTRSASAYNATMRIQTTSGFGTWYGGSFHTVGVQDKTGTISVPALPPAFNTLTATRVSDNQVNLSWTAASGNIKAVCIERSTDGGSYSEVAVIWNPAATSWQDTATSADHSYTYRARYHHEGAYGAYSNTVTVTMTPSAPQTISTAAISGSTNVAVTLGNASPVATSLEWQVSTDGGSTWSASNTVSGSPVTSFTASGISGTAYIRVRNVNATGTSDWLVSEQVTTICPPAAPTLISPTGVLDMSGGSVTFEWRHNPLDGSAQTAAQLAYSTDGGSTWTTVTKSTEQSHTISPIPWSAGTAVTWRVRTKGADASYGAWAQAVTFDVFTAPTLSITSPGATVTGMPISLAATYSDMAGFTCQAATVSLQKDGRTLYSEAATINGTSITASLDVSEFLPTNGESYTIVLTARSSSGLQTSANATFTTAFTEPQAGELSITNDPDTGYASLLATFDNSATDTPYSGNTNTQYSSESAFMKSLTVEGQSAVQSNTLVSIGSVTVTGQNLVDPDQLQNGYLQNNTTTLGGMNATRKERTSAYIPVTAGENLEIRYMVTPSSGETGWVSWQFYDAAHNLIGSRPTRSPSDANVNFTIGITAPTGANLIRVSCRFFDDGKLQLERGSTAHDYEPYKGSTITTTLRSAGSVHDQLQVGKTSWTVERKIGTRAYQAGDESDPDVLTDGTTTYYALTTPTTDTPTSMSTIEIGSAFTVGTELDSTFDMTAWDGSADAVSISVSRVNADGSITPLIEDGASGSGVVDKYAPLNTPYQYAVTTHAASQAVKTVYVDNVLETDRWFAYWGENIASAKWNPDNGGIQLSRPQKTRVYYAGRKDPVSYDGHAVALAETPSWMFIEREETAPFVQLIEDGGRGIYKSCDGWVYHADFDLTLTPKYTAIGYYGGVGLSVTRIAGERL